MKILWFSNINLIDNNINKSGTWIYSMFKGLCDCSDVDIVANVSFSNTGKSILIKSGGFVELRVPITYEQCYEDIPISIIKDISDFVDNISPDIIHIWGVETTWAAICQKVLNRYPQLIEIQGFKGVTGQSIHFDGGLDKLPNNILGHIEPLIPKYSLAYIKKSFRKWERYEKEVISNAKYINTQSNWVRDVLKFHFNTSAIIFDTYILLRNSFINPDPWTLYHKTHSCHENYTPVLFSISSSIPYKGAHLLIEAVSLLKKYYPDIKLRIAGISITPRNIKSSGYIRYIKNLITFLGLNDNVELLGNITEDKILQELYRCDLFVNPTFIETFCLALAEALSVGVPTVSSYVAAIPELVDGSNGLLFPVGDSISLAASIDKILSNPSLSIEISNKAYKSMSSYNDYQKIIKNQIDIYRFILNSENH